MPLTVVCSCGKRLRVADETKGKKVRCPGCKSLLLATDSAAPTPPVATTKEKPAVAPAPKASTSTPSQAPGTSEAPKAKKSSTKMFLLVGCGCLGLVGGGIAAVVAVFILAVATHKGPKDKLVGEWVLDKEANQKYYPAVLQLFSNIHYDFKKNGDCILQINQKTFEATWEVSQGKDGKFVLSLRTGQGSLDHYLLDFKDNDHIEIGHPVRCRLRRASVAENNTQPGGPDDKNKGTTPGSSGDKDSRLLAAHKKGIFALAFSPDGNKLASGSADETVCVWDVPSGTVKQTLRNLSGPARGVAILADGKTVITASGTFSDGGFVKSWDADSGQMKAVLHKQKNYASVLAMSPDGKFLAWDDGTWVVLWDVAGGAVRATFKDLEGIAKSLAFSRDGKRLAACESSGSVRIWDVEKSASPSLGGRVKDPVCLAWTPSGDLAVGSVDKRVMLWSLASKKARRGPSNFPGEIRSVAVSPDGKILAVASGNTIKSFDANDYRDLASWRSTSRGASLLGSLVFSPDSKMLAVGSADVNSGGIFLLKEDTLLKSK